MQYILIKNINKKAPRIFYYPNATNMLPFYKICVRYCYGKSPLIYITPLNAHRLFNPEHLLGGVPFK